MTRPASPRWWAPALLIMGAMWWLSSQGDPPGPNLGHPFDWILHFVAYALLGYSLGRATGRPLWALVLVAWWGASDEVHQAFVAGREAGLTDWLFDLAGGAFGVAGTRGARSHWPAV